MVVTADEKHFKYFVRDRELTNGFTFGLLMKNKEKDFLGRPVFECKLPIVNIYKAIEKIEAADFPHLDKTRSEEGILSGISNDFIFAIHNGKVNSFGIVNYTLTVAYPLNNLCVATQSYPYLTHMYTKQFLATIFEKCD